MRFLFFPHKCIPLYRTILDEQSLGGVETGILLLANALVELGHEVFIFSDILDEVKVNPFFIRLGDPIPPFDILICVRAWQPIFYNIQRKKTFLWTGDDANIVHNYGIGDPRVYNSLDGLLGVSQWQADNLCRSSGFPSQKVWILRNGVCLENFTGNEVRHKKRLIYSSHPSRGLVSLLVIFEHLKRKYPDLELHVFGGVETHGKIDHMWEPLYDNLRQQQGCVVHGSVLQRRLAREFMRSSIWAFPSFSVLETSCITAMEAQAAGCAIVTSAQGALPETVGEAGILIKETPKTLEFLGAFVETIDSILSDEALFQKLSRMSLKQAKTYDWKLRALSFLDYLKSVHKME